MIDAIAITIATNTRVYQLAGLALNNKTRQVQSSAIAMFFHLTKAAIRAMSHQTRHQTLSPGEDLNYTAHSHSQNLYSQETIMYNSFDFDVDVGAGIMRLTTHRCPLSPGKVIKCSQ
jgi:hypothetical protein